MEGAEEKMEDLNVEDELNLPKRKTKKKKDKKEDDGGEGETGEKPAADSPAAPVDEDEAAFLEDLKNKKKKEKKPKPADGGVSTGGTEEAYTYQFLLNRVFDGIRAKHPELAGAKKKYTLKPPNVVRDGTKKSAFTNFAEICRSMARSQEHLQAFILTELGTSGSLDGNCCLILRGRFQSKHIEGLLRRYIQEYVQCAMCHSLDTKLEKDQNSRLYQMSCNNCGASRTVAAINPGYKAQVGKRKKQ
eukprot:RCo022172